MKYLKSRSQFIENRRNKLITEEKKYNLILEGGLENDLKWGDTVVGRIFASMFRVAKMGVDIKRIEGAGNALRQLFLNATREGFKDPKLKEDLETIENNIKLTGYVDGLIEQLKAANVKNIQQYIIGIPDDVTPEVLSIISGSYNFTNPKSPKNKDKEVIDVLLSIESWEEEEQEEEEESSEEDKNVPVNNDSLIKNIKENLKELKNIIDNRPTENQEVIKKPTPDEEFKRDTSGGETKKNTSNKEMIKQNSSIQWNLTNESNIDDIHYNESLKNLINKIDGLKTTRKFIDRLFKVEDKILINIYKTIHGGLKANTYSSIPLFKESVDDVSVSNNISDISKEIAMFYKFTEQYENHKNFYDKMVVIGKSLESFNSSMKKIRLELDNKSTNESVFSDFEQKDNDETNINVEDNTIKNIKKSDGSIKYMLWFNNKILPIQKNLINLLKNVEEEQEKLNKEAEKNIYILDVIEIIKIFKKASRLYIKTRIPSNRSGGKITTFRSNNWETTSGGTVDPDRPDGGPFRNIKLYEKWSKIVLDIVNEFDYMLKRDTSMVRLSDNSEPIKPDKSIYDFIIQALEGDKISGVGKGTSKSNQLEFLEGYFGKVPENLSKEFGKLGYDNEPSSPKSDDLFKEVNKIDTSESNLYRITLDKSISSSIGYYKYIYLYHRVKDGDKVIYLFEDNKIIEDNKQKDLKFGLKSPGSIDDYFWISKLSENFTSSKDLKDFEVIKSPSGNPELIKSDIKVTKIEKYRDDKKRMILNFGTIKGFGSIQDVKNLNNIKNRFGN
jgi:hypothetical protein